MRWVNGRNKKFLLVKCSDKTLVLLSDKLQPVKGFPLPGNNLYINNDASRILIEDGEVAKFYELN